MKVDLRVIIDDELIEEEIRYYYEKTTISYIEDLPSPEASSLSNLGSYYLNFDVKLSGQIITRNIIYSYLNSVQSDIDEVIAQDTEGLIPYNLSMFFRVRTNVLYEPTLTALYLRASYYFNIPSDLIDYEGIPVETRLLDTEIRAYAPRVRFNVGRQEGEKAMNFGPLDKRHYSPKHYSPNHYST